MTAVETPSTARPDSTALIGLCIAGCLMLALAAGAPWIVRTFGYATFIPLLALSGLCAAASTRWAAALPARTGVLIVLGFALAMRLALVGVEPLMSTDIYRYVWDGRVQAAGINPYLYVPADPALAALRDAAIYPRINRADYAITGYPPVAEMFFLAATRISESLVAMRLAMVACEVVIIAALIALLRRLGRNETAIVAYAWHPLAVFEIANNGHVEVLAVALMMLGVWLLVVARNVLGAAAVAAAALVKPYAVLILPAFWRPWDWRVPVAVAGVIVACYLPNLGAGRNVLGFLGSGYLSEEGLTTGEGIWLVALAHLVVGKIPVLAIFYVLAAAVIMIWLGLRVSYRGAQAPERMVADVVLLITVGLFLMSPNYAWYFLALVPFLALGAGAAIWALTLGAFLIYRPFLLPENDILWKTLATLPFLIALVFTRGRLMAKEA